MAIIWDKATFAANYSICPRGVYTYPDGHTEAQGCVHSARRPLAPVLAGADLRTNPGPSGFRGASRPP